MAEDKKVQHCLVVMRNITTSSDLAKGQRPELAGMGKSELGLLIPEGSCSEGHLLLIRFFEEQEYLKVRNSPRSVQDKAQLLAVTAKVSRLEPAADHKVLATLELQQFADKSWQGLVKSLTVSLPKAGAATSKRAKS